MKPDIHKPLIRVYLSPGKEKFCIMALKIFYDLLYIFFIHFVFIFFSVDTRFVRPTSQLGKKRTLVNFSKETTCQEKNGHP